MKNLNFRVEMFDKFVAKDSRKKVLLCFLNSGK